MTPANISRHSGHPARREAATHVFTVGQAVRIRSGFRGPFRFMGVCHVTATLPLTGNSPQYRIQSDDELYERVTTQESLEAALVPDENGALIEGTFGRRAKIETRQPVPEPATGQSDCPRPLLMKARMAE